ncbi:unnamed protein product [Cuscuta campestris]|uniref:Retrotransposon gag domain-containing protein n=1 Tax=Cuscuta campestris TaxID=132261 RepID=A0A484LBW5_9ASTE|nr:unnamed protein product [Cuscuta campestris]
MSHTSQNITKEDLVASNAELKAQVEYLAKQVAQLTKMKLKMTETPEESEDEQEEESHAETPSSSIRKDNQEKSSTGFKVEISTFDGKDDPDDFIEWLETVERVFDYVEVPEDKKVKLVALKFRGYASTWWTNTTTKRKREGKAVVQTWTKMRALLKKFIPTDYIRENFARLQHLRQGNRSVEEYNREFEELLMRCDLQENDSQTFVRYLFGLNTQIANTVELQTFESLEESTKLALKGFHEDTHERKNTHFECTRWRFQIPLPRGPKRRVFEDEDSSMIAFCSEDEPEENSSLRANSFEEGEDVISRVTASKLRDIFQIRTRLTEHGLNAGSEEVKEAEDEEKKIQMLFQPAFEAYFETIFRAVERQVQEALAKTSLLDKLKMGLFQNMSGKTLRATRETVKSMEKVTLVQFEDSKYPAFISCSKADERLVAEFLSGEQAEESQATIG